MKGLLIGTAIVLSGCLLDVTDTPQPTYYCAEEYNYCIDDCWNQYSYGFYDDYDYDLCLDDCYYWYC